MTEPIKIIDTDSDNILNYGICGYKNLSRPGYPEKIQWLQDRFAQGLKIKTLYSEKDGTLGMIEYIPGEYCWRPVEATGYMFIHCIFSGTKSAYKGKGYGSLLLQGCITDAQKENKHGVAVVTRQGSFMVGKALFEKNGFTVVDTAKPDFELLAIKFTPNAPDPQFFGNWEEKLKQYRPGLIILRADQCPYTVKNVGEICATAEKKYGIKPTVIDLKSFQEAQNTPGAFGTFCLIYNNKVISHHPISNTRFCNIMDKLIGKK